jgi:predicted nucleic acid-binding Zn ribbon protein
VKRRAPRPLAAALAGALPAARPPGLLAAVQSAWPGVVGPALAAAAAPVAERAGVVTVACESAVWAQELELLGPDLRDRLNAALDGAETAELRFVVGSRATDL